jgi:hypothetical protein
MVIAGLAAEAAALAICWGYWSMLSGQAADLSAKAEEIAKNKTPKAAAAVNPHEAEEKQLRAEIDRLQKAAAETAAKEKLPAERLAKAERTRSERAAVAAAAEAAAKGLGERLPALLAAVAACDAGRGGKVLLDRVAPDPDGGYRVEGLCKRPEHADDFAVRMQRALAPAGWEVGAAQKRANPMGESFSFWVLLTVRVPPTPAAPAAPAAPMAPAAPAVPAAPAAPAEGDSASAPPAAAVPPALPAPQIAPAVAEPVRRLGGRP